MTYRKEVSKQYWERNKPSVQKKNRVRNAQRNQTDRVGMMLYVWKARAKKLGVPFALTRDDILIPTHCPVLGIKLKYVQSKTQSNTPSLDRLVPKRGYVAGNVKVISMRANMLKSNATKVELEKVICYITENE